MLNYSCNFIVFTFDCETVCTTSRVQIKGDFHRWTFSFGCLKEQPWQQFLQESAWLQTSSLIWVFQLKNVSLFSFSWCAHLEDGLHLLRLNGNVIPSSGTACLAALLPVNRWSLDSARTIVSRQGRVRKYAHMLFKVQQPDTGGWNSRENIWL